MSARTRRGKQRKQGGGTRGARRNGGNQMIPHPPPIQSFGITHATKLRFITNAAVQQQVITFQNLLDTFNFATSAVTAFQVFNRVKVRAVELWATPVIGNATSVQCEFTGNQAAQEGDGAIHTDTSMGIEPAHVRARPSARSPLALFQGPGGAGVAFTLTCPSGTVVDVELTLRALPGVATATTNVPAAATTGAWYYRGLDGLAAAATVFVPVVNTSGTD